MKNTILKTSSLFILTSVCILLSSCLFNTDKKATVTVQLGPAARSAAPQDGICFTAELAAASITDQKIYSYTTQKWVSGTGGSFSVDVEEGKSTTIQLELSIGDFTFYRGISDEFVVQSGENVVTLDMIKKIDYTAASDLDEISKVIRSAVEEETTYIVLTGDIALDTYEDIGVPVCFIAGGNYSIYRGSGDYYIIADGASVGFAGSEYNTLTLNGGSLSSTTAFLDACYSGGEIRIYDGVVIKDCINSSNTTPSVISAVSYGVIYMEGGTITGCTGGPYGMIYVEDGTFYMSGGTITGNTFTGMYSTDLCYAGVILATNNSAVNMTGGSITSNTYSGAASPISNLLILDYASVSISDSVISGQTVNIYGNKGTSSSSITYTVTQNGTSTATTGAFSITDTIGTSDVITIEAK